MIQIKLILPNEPIPEGYELISSAHSGNEAPSLLSRGFLVIKRADTSSVRHLHANEIIDDIQFLKKSANEQLPERFQEISVLPWMQENYHLHGRNAAEYSIVLHRRAGLGLCNLVYESATIDRYPKQVNKYFIFFAFLSRFRLKNLCRNRFFISV